MKLITLDELKTLGVTYTLALLLCIPCYLHLGCVNAVCITTLMYSFLMLMMQYKK